MPLARHLQGDPTPVLQLKAWYRWREVPVLDVPNLLLHLGLPVPLTCICHTYEQAASHPETDSTIHTCFYESGGTYHKIQL